MYTAETNIMRDGLTLGISVGNGRGRLRTVEAKVGGSVGQSAPAEAAGEKARLVTGCARRAGRCGHRGGGMGRVLTSSLLERAACASHKKGLRGQHVSGLKSRNRQSKNLEVAPAAH